MHALRHPGRPFSLPQRARNRPVETTTYRVHVRLVSRGTFETLPRGYIPGEVETSPIEKSVVAGLEALKWQLAAMDSPDELPADQAAALRAEISAIRLHLKRLDLDRPQGLRRAG